MRNRGSAHVAVIAAMGMVMAPVLFWTATEASAKKSCDPGFCSGTWFEEGPKEDSMTCPPPCPPGGGICTTQIDAIPGGGWKVYCKCSTGEPKCYIIVTTDAANNYSDATCGNPVCAGGLVCRGPQ